VLNERSADVRVLTDAVDDGIHQRKRAQEKDQRNSRVATRTIQRGSRRGDSRTKSNRLKDLLPLASVCLKHVESIQPGQIVRMDG